MNGVEQGLARLRDFRWDLYAQPLRETRLEMRVVYFEIPVPFRSGVTVKLPLLTMIKPMSSPSAQSQIGAEPAID